MGSQASAVVMPLGMTDSELVEAVRAGEDAAFEELYRRYEKRIEGFVLRMVRDPGRAEDVTQETFLAALRRLRTSEGPLAFRPWIYEIARNASIDQYRRTSRAEEVPIEEEAVLRAVDRTRFASTVAPEAALYSKQRIEHLRGALDELPHSHNRVLVLRELEGLSYREIADRMEMTRGAVESTLFRARRRLEVEFSEIDTGRRCTAMRRLAARQAEGECSVRERLRLDRHLRRCAPCARHARGLGVQRMGESARTKVAALLPLPVLGGSWRASAGAQGPVESGSAQQIGATWVPFASHCADAATTAVGKSAVLIAAAALAGGGATLGGGGPLAQQLRLDRGTATQAVHASRRAPVRAPSAPLRRRTHPATVTLAPARVSRDLARQDRWASGLRKLSGGARASASRPPGPSSTGLPQVKLPPLQQGTPVPRPGQPKLRLPQAPGPAGSKSQPASRAVPVPATEATGGLGVLKAIPDVRALLRSLVR